MILFLMILLCEYPTSAQTADSPWPQFRHDAQHTGQSPYVGPELPDFKWRIEGRYLGMGVDGTIYYSEGDYSYNEYENNLEACDTEGNHLWTFLTEAPVPYYTAEGDDGTIYFGTEDHYLYALNPEGTLKWKVKTDDSIITPVTIGDDDNLYFCSLEKPHYLWAVDRDGKTLWKFELEFDQNLDESFTPAIGYDGTIYTATEKEDEVAIYAVNPDGNLKWRTMTDGIGLSSTIAIGSSDEIYVCIGDVSYYMHYEAHLLALSPDGEEMWRVDNVSGDPAIDPDGTVYVRSIFYNNDSNFSAVNPDGSIKWSQMSADTPVLIDPARSLYFSIIAGESKNRFYYNKTLNPDGSLKWWYEQGIMGSCVPSGILPDRTVIYHCSGHFYALKNADRPPSVDIYSNSIAPYKNGDRIEISVKIDNSLRYIISMIAALYLDGELYFYPYWSTRLLNIYHAGNGIEEVTILDITCTSKIPPGDYTFYALVKKFVHPYNFYDLPTPIYDIDSVTITVK